MELRDEGRYPPTINSALETEVAVAAAASLVGASNVRCDMLPSMAEDFAWFLEKKPGAYIWIGKATRKAGGCCTARITSSTTLPLGASYWVHLAESILSKDRATLGQS
jgi:metal-dependent amidase/aminoacylase/carboxypeptidase family protein